MRVRRPDPQLRRSHWVPAPAVYDALVVALVPHGTVPGATAQSTSEVKNDVVKSIDSAQHLVTHLFTCGQPEDGVQK